MQNREAINKDMLGRSAIVPLSSALEKLHRYLSPIPTTEEEMVPLQESLGRFLAHPISAQEDLPPHPRSTMDGFAVKAADTFGEAENRPVYLKISGDVPMGTMPDCGPGNLECHTIATGGFLPPGTDSVVMLEHTVKVDSTLVELIKAVSPGENIIRAGDDLQTGDQVLAKGKKLRPQELGLLAGLGCTDITVHKQVKVGIFSTGDEIVPYTETVPPGKIRDMNGMHLGAMARQLGALTNYYGIAADVESSFSTMLQKALEENDLVLFSGSSSVGTRDLGEKIIQKLADPGIIIHGVAIKPGKPVIAAFADHKPVFGLPGHPVSAAVAFDLFVKPCIQHISGQKFYLKPPKKSIKAQLKRNLNSAAGRTDFVRIRLLETAPDHPIQAHPVLGKSGALSTMVKADGYLIIDEDSQGAYEDEIVEVFLFE